MKINTYILKIKKLGACEEAVLNAHKHDTSQELWDKCERGDWMLWLVGQLSGEPETQSRKKLVLTACKCARLSLKYVAKDELRPLRAIETAEAWASGNAKMTLDIVRAATNAAANATYAANAAYATNAAYAAANAAKAAYAAAYAANAAAYAAYAANAAAKNKTLKQCADIVRADYPYIDDLFKKEAK